jgi:L-Ala-D/L-Glu epimerase
LKSPKEPMDITSSELNTTIESWPLSVPFRITGYTWEVLEILRVTISASGQTGEGEAAGVYYRGDTPQFMQKQVEAVRALIEERISRATLRELLPSGGARNAVDCALWDLEAKLTGVPAWQTASLSKPHPVLTTFTCGADTPANMAAKASAADYAQARAIKLKLTGDAIDVERVKAVRAARPDVWLGVDANQGFTLQSLTALIPTLMDARVQVIEQPFPVGQDSLLDGLNCSIPIAADESAQTLRDIDQLSGRFQAVNIKLDKCGGLTEALLMAHAARKLGLDTMVGNMIGTSLAMAPAIIVAQTCRIVDLDGPLFLKSDRSNPVEYVGGFINYPKGAWGY